MRKILVAAGLACAMAALPVTATAGAASAAKLKGKGSGTLTLSGTNDFSIDGTVKVAQVGPVAFHTEGITTGGGGVEFTTTFTAANGDTVTTASTGSARQTKLGRIFITRDTVTGGTGRFAAATGFGRTAAKAKLAAPNATTGTVKFILAGKITY
jgi:hypothetical protein